MSGIINTTVKNLPDGTPTLKCGQSFTGTITVTAAGVGGTVKVYTVINGARLEVASETAACNPPLQLTLSVGDDYCIEVDSTDCVFLSVEDAYSAEEAA